MQSLFTLFGFIIVSFFSSLWGQSEWEIHTAISAISDLEFHDNVAYVANSGGLLTIDLATKEETLYNKGNSNFRGIGCAEIEIQNDGAVWFVSRERGQLHSYMDGDFKVHMPDTNRISALEIVDSTVWFLAEGIQNGIWGAPQLFSYRDGIAINHTSSFNTFHALAQSQENVWVLSGFYHLKEYDGHQVINSRQKHNRYIRIKARSNSF